MAAGRYLALLVFSFAAVDALALSDEEIERRFQQLEQENSALKEKLQRVENYLESQGIDPEAPMSERTVSASKPAAVETVADDLAELERRYKEDSERFQIQGFMSAGVTLSDEKGGTNHEPYGFKDTPDFESDSVLGLQMSFNLTDNAHVVTQIVANGWDDWDPNVEWAYLAYDFTEDYTVRAGRMRLPLYLYSESLDVGYTYPWVRPPLAMYTPEISNYDGFDATYRFGLGEANHRLSAFFGSYDFNVNEFDQDVRVSGESVYGINWETYWKNWTFRLAYTHLKNVANFQRQTGIVLDKAFVEPGVIPPEAEPFAVGAEFIIDDDITEAINFYTYAFAYDDGTWLMILEASMTESEDEILLGDERQGVLTLGYQFSDLMPYTGFGVEYYDNALDDDNPFARTLDKDYKMFFLGLRYDIVPGVAAKLEWNHFYDFKGTAGPFEDADAASDGGTFDASNLYTFLIDVVF